MPTPARTGPTPTDLAILVAGYAISFGLPRLSLLAAAHQVAMNGPSWWPRGWPVVLDAAILGPTVAGPLLWWNDRRRSADRRLLSGLSLWCGLGLLKWAHIAAWYAFYGRRYDILTWICDGFALITLLWVVAIMLRRPRSRRHWANTVGMILGCAWIIYSAWNFYSQRYLGMMSTL